MQCLKKRRRNTIRKLCVVFGVLLLLTGCSADAASPDKPVEKPDVFLPEITLTNADMETECQTAAHIDLNQFDGENWLISQPGCYVLSGELNGSLQINVEDQIIHLVLNGVTVDSPYGPALEVLSAGKVFITLQEGSENFFSDGAVYPDAQDPDACIYSACDLTINGSGNLHVYGYYKDAIHSKDVLKILGGTIYAQSKRNGLRGNDGVVINRAQLNIQSERNGIQSTKNGDGAKGNIEISSSECSIIGGNYAISCAADLYIADSNVHAIGILSDIKVDGTSRIEEGNLRDE